MCQRRDFIARSCASATIRAAGQNRQPCRALRGRRTAASLCSLSAPVHAAIVATLQVFSLWRTGPSHAAQCNSTRSPPHCHVKITRQNRALVAVIMKVFITLYSEVVELYFAGVFSALRRHFLSRFDERCRLVQVPPPYLVPIESYCRFCFGQLNVDQV